MSESLRQLVKEADIVASCRSDHSIPWITLAKGTATRGTGFWKLKVIQEHEMAQVTWEMLKMTVRGLTIQYATRKRKEKDSRLIGLRKKAKVYEEELAKCIMYLSIATGF